MVDFDASPQSRAVKKLLDACISLDMKNIEPLLPENYQYEALPECIDLPGQTKESHLQAWGGIFSLANKLEMIYHELIEAPGKVVLHATCVFSTVFGATLNYDTLLIYTLAEDDGKLEILQCKDFADPRQRGALIAGTVKAAAERVVA